MKIAIIGSGISGLSCAYYLRQHDVTLYESNDYLGGHTATKRVEVASGNYDIDTGFIVYNDRTYPRFIRFLKELGIDGQATEMSFSVRNDSNGLEYNGHSIGTLFAQKRNWLNPRFYTFIREILRFNKLAKQAVEQHSDIQTLGQFLKHHKFNDYFSNNYILPMGAAIWSTSLDDMLAFPLVFFLKFFLNHGLLDINNRPQWYVIPNGSHSYIKAMQPHLQGDIRLSSPVVEVQREPEGVQIKSRLGDSIVKDHFDRVIFACHSDQALALLADPSKAEQDILTALRYEMNEVVLHTDASLLPKRQKAWAAWNYRIPNQQTNHELPKVTYNMNILQGVSAPETFCVTLNDTTSINPNSILGKYHYAHPQYSNPALVAQQRRAEINGRNNSWFCGAYWYNGFHEDGLRSAQDVVEALLAQHTSAGNVTETLS
jgi:predicted NAD/FAD-binding protein